MGLILFFALYLALACVWCTFLVPDTVGAIRSIASVAELNIPIMRVTLLGLFMAAPIVATLAVLVAGEILVQIQVRLEEAHLSGMHGEQYEVYQATVRLCL